MGWHQLSWKSGNLSRQRYLHLFQEVNQLTFCHLPELAVGGT